MIKNSFYLKIADFIIKIQFIDRGENINFFDSLMINLKQKYIDFLITMPSSKQRIDYHINIINTTRMGYFKKTIKGKKSFFFELLYKKSNGKVVTYSSISGYQFEAILKFVLSELLNRSHSFVIHTSSILINNRAILFLGESNSGKSTIVNLLKEKYIPLVDDVGFIKKIGAEFYFYQTPYIEQSKYKIYNQHWRIGAIFFLHKNKKIIHYKKRFFDNNIQKIIKYLKYQIHTDSNIKDFISFLIYSKNSFYDLSFTLNKPQLFGLFSQIEKSLTIDFIN